MKRYRSKPCPGVDDWAKMNKTGEMPEEYYSRTSDGDGYYGVYHTLARKYDWNHEPKKIELPPGASRRFSTILNCEVESYTRQFGDVHITINRYGKDDSKVQVLIANLRTGETANGSMLIDEVDKFISDNTR